MWVCMLRESLGIIIGYLLDSIPTAYIMAHLRASTDIRDPGSGNMGTANILRQIGVWEDIAVGFLKMTEGGATILVALAQNSSPPW